MKKDKCKQIQLKLPFEPDGEAEADVEVKVIPLDFKASHHLEQHSKGLVDKPELVEKKPVRVSVGPDLSWLTGEEVS